ncbi:MAG: glycosyltransferase family 2 protein [Bacteroidales bacterium]|nr:glycosyltransferase family 2 protein [Bacteroidales bacterium]MDD4673578.1 glycosyltransferase family 2 protein [Bacteroidales bacterium]MDY0347814.1 glycosyltransferase family 2 protein [Tenuifilaceae bacterium]
MIAPKITVIIPIYNCGLYLTDTLQSIQNQVFPDFECICVNDGSVDSSEAIIDQFTVNDKRFIKINQANLGVSAARNAGMNLAKGEFLYFVDHDDLIVADTLQNLLNAAEAFNADMSRGRMIMISDNYALTDLPKQQAPTFSNLHENPLTDFYRNARRKNKTWCYIWQCLFRHSAIKNIRFLESLRSGREDNLFMYEVVANIKNYVQIDSVVACHRRSSSSVMLGGYRPVHIQMFDIAIPYVYQKYAMDTTIDKRLLWWVYHKESYGVYRFLIRNPIRSNQHNLMLLAREVLLKYRNTPEFKEIKKRWSYRQVLFYKLFMNEQYKLLRFFRILMF